MEYNENNNDLRTAIEEYVKDVLEVDSEDVAKMDDDELWGEVLDWINWLTETLAARDRKIERIEELLYDELDEDGGEDSELEDNTSFGYDDLECDGDE